MQTGTSLHGTMRRSFAPPWRRISALWERVILVMGQFEVPPNRSTQRRTTVHSNQACWIPACAGMTTERTGLESTATVMPAKAGIQPLAVDGKIQPDPVMLVTLTWL